MVNDTVDNMFEITWVCPICKQSLGREYYRQIVPVEEVPLAVLTCPFCFPEEGELQYGS